GYADASKELSKALGKAYSFPGALADPEVYAALVKMARFAIKGKLHDFERFLAELKAARNAAKMADLSPAELAKAKQAWEEAKVLEAAERATYEKLNKVIPDTAKLDALVAKAGDPTRLQRLLQLFTEGELDSIFLHLKDPKKLLSVFDHMNHATAKNMLLEMVSKGKIDKLNNFIERVAAGGAQLGETAAVGSKSLIIDSQAAIALIKDANGVALQPGEKAWVAYLKSLPGDVELRVGNMTVGEIQGGVITVKGMPLDVAATASRQAPAYQDALRALENAGVGGKGGLADRAVIADALFAKVEAGVTPTIALADQNAVKNLARLAGIDVVKARGYKGLVTSYGSTGFKVTIEGRAVLIRPLPAVK
ncbi:MAG TPA: hypothetical protein PKU97_10180, partial [Kofleriaceae bacterium]|nr:hypothetical protein [Kofleriaceae bacterium]